MKAYYTYLWLRNDGTPYYAGKGTGSRGFTNHGHSVPYPGRIRTLVQEFLTEADAFEAEKFLIAYYGRKDLGTGCLRNRTDGGEGVSGRVLSQETRDKLALGQLGRRGFRHSVETREQMSRSKKGRLFYRQPYKTHCKHGHEFTEDNIYTHPNKRGRACRKCIRGRKRHSGHWWRQKKKEQLCQDQHHSTPRVAVSPALRQKV